MNNHSHKESIGRWISILHRNAFVYFNSQFKQFGIGGAQIRPLLYIFRHPGVRQDDISKVFSKDKGTVARAIKKLEEVDLVYREKDMVDKRAYNLFPTDKALDQHATMTSILEGWSDILTQGFTEEEHNQLLGYLKRMADNVNSKQDCHNEENCHE